LTPASLKKMTTPFKGDYACGLYVKRVNGHLMIEHDGNNIGFNSDMAYYPEDRIAVIVLANLNGTVTSEMTRALGAVARGESPPTPSVHKEVSLSKEVLARYAGTYQFPHYSLKMVPEDNHLLVEFENGGTLALFPESDTKFFSKPWPEGGLHNKRKCIFQSRLSLRSMLEEIVCLLLQVCLYPPCPIP
jgi:hypothetical protein